MAKKENIVDVTKGLTYGASKTTKNEIEKDIEAEVNEIPADTNEKVKTESEKEQVPSENENKSTDLITTDDRENIPELEGQVVNPYSLASTYERKMLKPRAMERHRFQATVPVDMFAKLSYLDKIGKIKSTNSLILFLLEQYLNEYEQKNGPIDPEFIQLYVEEYRGKMARKNNIYGN